MTRLHPVGQLLQRATFGDPPAVDGGWTRESPWRADVFGIVTFTGHAVLCVPDSVTDATLAALRPDGFGGAADPRVIVSLAGADRWIDSLDVILAARGTGGCPDVLVPRPDLADRPRVRLATRLRSKVRVLGLPDRDDVVLTVGEGVGLLLELSFELDAAARGNGLGRRLIADARALCAPDQVILVSVAPGNVASMRASLAAGFRPIAGVQLFRPDAWT